MEVIEAIKTRRSIRKYKAESVPEETVATILDCGRWAPSASNRQPWQFIVLKDSEVRKRLGRALPAGAFVADAPLAIAVVIDPGGIKPSRGGWGSGDPEHAPGSPRCRPWFLLDRQLQQCQ